MMLKLTDVVRQMRKSESGHASPGRPRPFTIQYVTADRTRNKGGEVRTLKRAVLLTKKRTDNRIVDLQPLGTTDIVRVHLDLILRFNNQPVA